MAMAERSVAMLSVSDLHVEIGEVTVVKGLDFSVKPKELWGVLGQNGVGKSTLLKALAGVHPIESGEILLHGQALHTLPRRQIAQGIGMLTQQTQYVFEASCEQTAMVGRHPHLKAWIREQTSDYTAVAQALKVMGLEALAKRSCMDLSGGESRRLAIATLLVQDPDIYLLDEPTNHLDPASQVSTLNVVGQHIRVQHKAGVMALHEVNLATCYCSHCLMLFGQGEWLAGPTEDLLTAENLSRLYQCQMRLVDDGEHQVFAVAG